MTAQAGGTAFQARPSLRSDLRARRRALNGTRRRLAESRATGHAAWLVRHLGARNVALTLPVGSELDTCPLVHHLLRSGVRVYLPCLLHDGDGMVMRRWQGGALRRGKHDIPEPANGARIARNRLDLIFLPLLAADCAGNRLGSGAGYYDRWLQPVCARQRPLRVGLCFDCQLVDRLDAMPWDVPLHGLITESGWRPCRAAALR